MLLHNAVNRHSFCQTLVNCDTSTLPSLHSLWRHCHQGRQSRGQTNCHVVGCSVRMCEDLEHTSHTPSRRHWHCPHCQCCRSELRAACERLHSTIADGTRYLASSAACQHDITRHCYQLTQN